MGDRVQYPAREKKMRSEMAPAKKIIHVVLLLVLGLQLFSCKKENRWDLFKRTGEMTLETRVLDPFTDITVGSNRINVFITQDKRFDVKVQAGKNLLSNIRTEVRDGRLYIDDDNKCNFARSYKFPVTVFIHMPKLNHIFHDGAGSIKSLNTLVSDTIDVITKSAGDVALDVNCYRMSVHMHSVSDITVTGTCNDNICYATGNGFYYSSGLASSYCWVWAKTTGEIYVNVIGLLQVNIQSVGDVYYRGNPTVQDVHVGTGRLVKE